MKSMRSMKSMKSMKNKKILIIFLLILPFSSFAQNYDEERINLALFIERMYNNAPFDGCRIIDDYDNSYLLSVVTLDKVKYKSMQTMNRVAQVKSQRNAGEFFNGTQTYSEFIIKTPLSVENKSNLNISESIEIIKSNTSGFIQQMQLLTLFEENTGLMVFVYYKKIK